MTDRGDKTKGFCVWLNTGSTHWVTSCMKFAQILTAADIQYCFYCGKPVQVTEND